MILNFWSQLLFVVVEIAEHYSRSFDDQIYWFRDLQRQRNILR